MDRPKGFGKAQVVGVAEFKARCLELLEAVRKRGNELVITKRGEPIARVTPVAAGQSPLRGMLRGRLKIKGDIVHVDWTDEWESAR
ncbi:MAG: type II toxin-antitoxin system prevent-host-death family antitoxin [Acidobacteria bacterium]|nr:type II toxin-antitoxin system prevent-host-death family antitoxin [Acidobacteriota bacterium]